MEEYPTSDLREAAYLAVLGFPHEFDRRQPKVIIIFQGNIDLIRFKLRDYWDNNTKVDARSLLICFTEMKKAIIGDNYHTGGRFNQVDSIQKNERKGNSKSDSRVVGVEKNIPLS